MSCSSCREKVKHSKVKVEEGKRFAIFVNDAREMYYRVQVDKCLVHNALAADYVVTRPGTGSVVVELKGTDVDHGAKQVDATAALLLTCTEAASLKPIAGLIVCARYPQFDSTIQRLQKQFAKKFQAPLHVVRDGEYEISRVLAFDGPN